jgi:hypothetical protein
MLNRDKMTSNHTKILFFFMAVCFLVSPGCISENKIQNTSVSSGTNTPVLTVIPTQCPPAFGNATPYIIINPISDHKVGDKFEINGTTNLGSDKLIQIFIDGDLLGKTLVPNPPQRPSFIDGEFIKTLPDTCGTSRWSFSVNLSGIKPALNPVSCWVQVTNQTVNNSTGFDVYAE